jgi:LDH2 family malate/lactate/ureidoglycolate dehydrogenase
MVVPVGGYAIPQDRLSRFVASALRERGSATEQADAVASALVSTSLRGVDSHGIRLLPHYLRALGGGRITRVPFLSAKRTAPGAATLDADNGFGHYAGYRAIAEGCDLARDAGIAGISVINSSHFGAAGCYALAAADAGFLAFAFCNSDPFVLPHDALAPFHGTNPIAFAAPVPGQRPLLLDMATSIVPWNRIRDYEMKGLPVPQDVSVDVAGAMTTDPAAVAALLSLGGTRFGFKGAGLAAVIEVLSAALTGMGHCTRLLPMSGPDMSTPRRLGQFYIVINPDAFVPRKVYEAGIAAYLADLRATPAKPGAAVLAPGDREWACMEERSLAGIPVAPALLDEFMQIAGDLGLDKGLLAAVQAAGGGEG